MVRFFALSLSYIFHPLLLTTLFFGMMYVIIPEIIQPVDVATIRQVLLVIFTLTFLIPFCSIVVMKLLGSIESLHMRKRRERLMPFFFIGAYYAVTTYLFATRLPFSQALIGVLYAITLVIFVVFVLTFFMKVSIHAAAAWGVVGLVLALHFSAPAAGLFMPMLLCLLLAGLISSSRLYLDEHSPAEVYTGAASGFLVCFITMTLML